MFLDLTIINDRIFASSASIFGFSGSNKRSGRDVLEQDLVPKYPNSTDYLETLRRSAPQSDMLGEMSTQPKATPQPILKQ